MNPTPSAPAHASTPSLLRPTSFGTTLVYESPMWIRVTIAGVCLLMFLVLAPGLLWRLRQSQGVPDTLFNSFMLAALILFTIIPYRLTRVRLIFGTHEIRSYGDFGWQALAYSEVGGFSLKSDRLGTGRGQTIDGEKLTIVGTGHRPSLSIFVYPDRPLDPRILERLRELVAPTARSN